LVKTAADEQAEALLAREARWLRALESVRELEGQVPRVLEEGTSPGGRRYLVVSMLPAMGRAAVAANVLASTEYRGIVVRRYYADLLHRGASSAEVSGWVTMPLLTFTAMSVSSMSGSHRSSSSTSRLMSLSDLMISLHRSLPPHG